MPVRAGVCSRHSTRTAQMRRGQNERNNLERAKPITRAARPPLNSESVRSHAETFGEHLKRHLGVFQEQFKSSSRAILEQIGSLFRAIREQLESVCREAAEQYSWFRPLRKPGIKKLY
eukprot:7012115-Prymnesium_polylepis.1